ncbi:MAG: 2,3-bisphosphoglycerate-dependent phosphoglycerate mutase, partial [Aureibaculum sp.]|nr:2,3-bisphosphoglycerate-dependent phosphoglycerate mutase [Aureibaculum sp.]
YWENEIVPAIKDNKKIIIAAHGNSLRALVKHLDKVTDAEILKVNIPTGLPLVYELDENLEPIDRYYLGDPEKVKIAMEAVANQGKAK